MINLHKILFIGLGGAGQRHLRIFRSLLPECDMHIYRKTNKTPLLNSNFTINQDAEIEGEYRVTQHPSLAQALAQKPNLTVISTPTSKHMTLALKALESGSHLLVEKPFSHDLEHFDKIEALAKSKNLAIFTSFQRRFNPLFKKVKSLINEKSLGNISSIIFNISSHVPDWHKYEDFKNLYACKKELGGGVLLTEIHEIDLCYWYFGLPNKVFCTGSNFSHHTLEVEDTVILILQYDHFNVTLNISFMQKLTNRTFKIYGEKISLSWDENKNKLDIFNHEKNKLFSQEEPSFDMNSMFREQALHIINNKNSFNYEHLRQARGSLIIVEMAKKSIKEEKIINISKTYRDMT